MFWSWQKLLLWVQSGMYLHDFVFWSELRVAVGRTLQTKSRTQNVIFTD